MEIGCGESGRDGDGAAGKPDSGPYHPLENPNCPCALLGLLSLTVSCLLQISQMTLQSVVRVLSMVLSPDIQAICDHINGMSSYVFWKIEGHFDLEGKLKPLILTDKFVAAFKGIRPDDPGGFCPTAVAWLPPLNGCREVNKHGLPCRTLIARRTTGRLA